MNEKEQRRKRIVRVLIVVTAAITAVAGLAALILVTVLSILLVGEHKTANDYRAIATGIASAIDGAGQRGDRRGAGDYRPAGAVGRGSGGVAN